MVEYFTSSLPHTEVLVDGYVIPYIDAIDMDDGKIELCLDRRFGISCTHEEVERWVPFLANAMAVAAGRTSHGENSLPRNPHGSTYPMEKRTGKEKIV